MLTEDNQASNKTLVELQAFLPVNILAGNPYS
jgi:hypothetical protein